MLENLGDLRIRLRWRHLLIAACILVVAAIISSNVIILWKLRESTLDDVADNLARRSLALAAQANLSFQSLSLVLDSVAEHVTRETVADRDYPHRGMGSIEVHELLKEKIVGLPQIEFVGLVGADGNLVNTSREWPATSFNVADRDYFIALRDKSAPGQVVSAPLQSRGTGNWTIVVARRLQAADGQFIGVLNGSVNLSFFEEHWRSILDAQEVDSSISLNRRDGTVLARLPSSDAVGRRFEGGVQDRLRDRPSVVQRKVSPIDHVRRIQSAHVLKDFPLFILATQTERSALQGWYRVAQIAALISTICIVVLLIAAFGVWRWWREHEHRVQVQSEKLEAEKARLIAETESRRHSESELQANRLNAAIENMSQGLLMIDPQERVLVVNSQYIRMYRLSPDIVKPGCSLPELFRHRHEAGQLATDPEQYRLQILAQVAQGKTTHRIVETPDGREISIVTRPVPGGGWVTTHDDITEPKRAERALAQSQRFIDTIIENAPVPIVVKEPITQHITLVNRAYEQFLGKRREELVGKTVHDIFPPGQAGAIARQDDEALRSGSRTIKGDLLLDTFGNGLRSVTATKLVVLDNDDRPQHLIEVIEDITERKAAQEQLRQSQKMDAIGHLTGGVAHDFNNILTVITGTVEILAEGVADRPALATIAKMIDEAATRGANLTQQLLAFSRKQPLQPRELDINLLINETAKLLRPTLGEHVEIESILEADAWHAMADPSQLSTALLNLSINARDAMPDGGKLTFESSNVVLDETYARTNPDVEPGSYVMLAVSDTGSGIPTAIRDRVFEPFFTTKQPGKGTGLGLSMVYGFVRQSLGHIKIYTEEGHGTTVRIYLPRAGAQPVLSSPAATDDTTLPGGKETILVVEDDALVRDYVLTQLRSLGYATLAAGNAMAALALVDGGAPFDLLFTDVIMPGGMNGRQLADEVKKRRPNAKVLFTSGYTENAVIHHGRLDPGVTLLAKPYRKRDLARMIREALRRPDAVAAAE
jgi:PAS domain S-box-containing protein